jgi:NADH dehydrogenase
VAADLSLPDHPEVFVVGDLAAATSGGEPVPAVATAAKQMGRAAAKNVLASIARRPRAPFVYSDKGSLAVIGRRKAVVQIGGLRYAGPGSFVLWAIVHLMVLGSFNRAGVLAKWMYAGVTAEVVSD